MTDTTTDTAADGTLAEQYAREAGTLSGLITRALIALHYGNAEGAIADLEEGYRIAHNGNGITYLTQGISR